MKEIIFGSKKDVEVKINGEVYGFNFTPYRIDILNAATEKGNLVKNRKMETPEEAKELMEFMEDTIEGLFGEEQFDRIFANDEPSLENMEAILIGVGGAMKEVGASEENYETPIEEPNEIIHMNRAQRRAQRRRKK